MRLALVLCVVACGSTTPPVRPANTTNESACIADRIPPLPKAPKQGKTCKDRELCAKACDARDGKACTALAWDYQATDGHESTTAARHFERGCELADPIACTNFAAGFASRPEATQADLRCAVRVYRVACEADEPWGCGMLGKALASGAGVPEDRTAANTVLEQSCTRIGSFPCFVLATLAEKRGDRHRAMELYQHACATGMDGACSDAQRLQQ